MSDKESRHFRIDGSMTVDELKTFIESEYAWALSIDWTNPENVARAWYVSEEKLEPRLGERFQEPIEEYEQALAPARDVARLYDVLNGLEANDNIAQFFTKSSRASTRNSSCTNIDRSTLCGNT